MKTIFLACCLSLFGITGSAQAPETIFSGNALPATQGWHELKFDSSIPWEQEAKDLLIDPSEITVAASTALKLKVNEGPGLYSQMGWFKPNLALSPAAGFTVEFKAKVIDAAPGSFNISGVGGGKGFRLQLSNSLLAENANVVDTMRVLSTANATDDFHTYRVAVAPDEKVRVWRNGVLIGELPLQTFKTDNVFEDGGFENTETPEELGWNWMDEARPGTLSISDDPEHVRTGKYGLFVDKGFFKNELVPIKSTAVYDVSVWGKTITYNEGDGQWRDFNGWYDPAGDRALYGVLDRLDKNWRFYERRGIQGGGGFQRFIVETPTGDANQNQAAFDELHLSERIIPSRIPIGAVNLFPNGDFEDPDFDYFPSGDPRNDTSIVNPDNYRESLQYYQGNTEEWKTNFRYDWDEAPFWHPFWNSRVRVQAGRQGNGESGNNWARSGKYSLRYFNSFSNTVEYGGNFSAARSQGRNTPLKANLELEIGKTYTFSFWYHFAQWGGDHLKLHVNNGNNRLWYKDITNADFPQWINVTVTFTTDAENHTLRFFTENTNERSGHDTWGDPGLLYFDDFFLFEGEPEPVFDGSYVFFGKPTSKKGTDVEIESITIDNTGAYAPDGSTYSSPYEKKSASIMTEWGENLQADEPILNEYPRPLLEREDWVNLNGIWDFTRRENKDGFGTYNATEAYRRQILVPFPVESALSGIMDTDYENMNKTYYYKRNFTVDPANAGKRIILHFGAVDWECHVFVNGTKVTHHIGGYDAFSADITDALTGSGEQELVVHVFDPTKGGNLRGKQDPEPGGIWYTPSSGIWQTVWYEAVDPTYVKDIQITPDVDKSAVKLFVDVANATDAVVEVTVMDGLTALGTQTIAAGQEVSVSVNSPKLWSPDSPFLYGLNIVVKKGGTIVDEASSYFGMRKVSLGKLRGKPYMFLNDEPIFHYGTLDQGFWPDGLHTAPSYEALRYDLEETKKLGMNMVRKHIKVEPARWFFYCDSIGLMVWQDMPTPAGLLATRVVGDGSDQAVKDNFLRETEAIVKNLRNYPSIVMWVPFNEEWGQFAGTSDPTRGDPSHTIAGVNLIKSLDDTRLINPASGWTSYEIGDIIDRHNYSEPALHGNPYNERASVCGETGGYGLAIEGHIWSRAANPYASVDSPEALAERFELFNSRAYALTTQGINGIVYTQITDVEEEVNGFLTYDRKVNKLALNDSVAGKVLKEGIEWLKTRALAPVLKNAAQGGELWRYVTGDPSFTDPGTGWNTNPAFDDSSWSLGRSSFGDNGTTSWTNQTIFLRKMVSIPELAVEDRNSLTFSIFHDEDFELYINGVLATSATGYITGYQDFEISEAAKAAINWGGDNLFAIHVIQTTGGQIIDLGVYTTKLTMAIDQEPAPAPDPVWIEISNAEEFKAMQNNLSGFYKLTADIDLYNEVNYQPIGSGASPFTGYFNGAGFTIICPEINNASERNQGLFGSARGAYFTDVKLTDLVVVGDFDVGGLLGRGVGVTIKRVVLENPVITGRDHTGAIVGGTHTGIATRISDSYVVNGTIVSTEWQAGGLLGVASDTRIVNSYFTGTVSLNLMGDSRDGGGIISRIEGGRNSMHGVVSLATSVTSGTANQFVSYGSNGTILTEMVNCFARNDMVMTDRMNPTRANQLPLATEAQKRPLEDFRTQAFYESIGWDFTNTWIIPEGGGFPVFKCLGCFPDAVPTVNTGDLNLKAYSSNGVMVLEAKQPASVWIYDLSGMLIDRLEVETIAHRSLARGIYIVKSVSNGKVEAVKVVN